MTERELQPRTRTAALAELTSVSTRREAMRAGPERYSHTFRVSPP